MKSTLVSLSRTFTFDSCHGNGHRRWIRGALLLDNHTCPPATEVASQPPLQAWFQSLHSHIPVTCSLYAHMSDSAILIT